MSRLVRRAGAMVALVVAASCGGQSERESGDSDGGNGGSATGGTSGTGGTPGTGGTSGAAGCEYGGRIYADGDGFPSTDGCNSCFCDAGAVACTAVDCPDPDRCELVAAEYQDALVRAKQCTVGAERSCLDLASTGLQCGCLTYVDDTTELVALSGEWNNLGCGGGVTCGACPDGPAGASCLPDGVCVNFNLQ